jgi:hypothetical protein
MTQTPVLCALAQIRKENDVNHKVTAVFAVAVSIGSAAVMPSPAAMATSRYPVMGCHNFQISGSNNYSVAYKPYGTCYLSNGIEAIRHVRWTGWGHKTADGSGLFLDGLGYAHPAHFVVSGLSHSVVCRFGQRATAYTRLHVTAAAVNGGGVRRPGGNSVFNVTPSDAGC